MTRHLFRLIWNRKRHNVLLSVEIFFSFLVVLVVVVAGLNVLNNWRQPLGYRIDNIWRVEISLPPADDAARAAMPGTLEQVMSALRQLPPVESAAGVSIVPYDSSDWGRGDRTLRISTGVNAATDDFADLMRLELIAGRWFSPQDDGASARPVVLNRRLARELFGDADPIGRMLPFERRPDAKGVMPAPERVVGVISDFRKGGELSVPQNFMFSRINPDRVGLEHEPFPGSLLIRVAPGTTAAFEETILDTLQPLARHWTFDVLPLAAMREASFDSYRVFLGVLGILAGFLLLMVALGLTGVVWQSVTERTREFGLRRAKGASVGDVRRQILIELALVASLAVVPGALLTAQIPALPMPNDWVIPDGLFLVSVAVSVAAIYLVVLACAWYPSRLATRIQPADALHYE